MRTNKISLIAALVLGGVLSVGSALAQNAATQDKPKDAQGAAGAGAAGAAGQERRGPGGPSVDARLAQLTEALKLTDEQKPKVKAALEEGQKKLQEFRTSAANTPQEERRTKMREIMEEQSKKLKTILTPEQFEKYEKMRAEGPRRGLGGPGRPGAGAPAEKGTDVKKD